MQLSIGEWTGLITVVGTLGLGIWTAKGKGRESAQTREDSLRQSLREAEKTTDECQEETAKLREQVSTLQRKFDTLLDFLRDIVGDSYPVDWIRKRAAELLKRMAP